MLLYMLEVYLAGDKIGSHPNHPWHHQSEVGLSGLGGDAAAP